MGRGARGIAFVIGLALVIVAAFGVADVVKHGRRSIGAGLVYGRYRTPDYCRPSGGCIGNAEVVFLYVERARATTTLDSSELYDLVGASGRRLPVGLEEDTFSHQISRVSHGGRWYVVASPNTISLLVIVPIGLLGLALVLLNILPLSRVLGSHLAAQRTWLRWTLLAGGSVLAVVCAALSIVGLQGTYYDAGRGEAYGAYASFGATGYREGVHVHVDGDGTTSGLESSGLYDLVGPSGRIVVNVGEDRAGKIVRVSYRGRAYRLGAPDALALVVTLPLLALGLALAIANLRALVRGRRGAPPTGATPAAASGR